MVAAVCRMSYKRITGCPGRLAWRWNSSVYYFGRIGDPPSWTETQ